MQYAVYVKPTSQSFQMGSGELAGDVKWVGSGCCGKISLEMCSLVRAHPALRSRTLLLSSGTNPAAGGGHLINFNAATNKEDADRYYIETSGD